MSSPRPLVWKLLPLLLAAALAYIGAVGLTGWVSTRRVNRFVGQTAAFIVALSPAAGTVAAILVAPGHARGWNRGRGRVGRRSLLVTVGILAGVSFLPWALGPLQFQLSSKDAPSPRTLTVLGYLFWAFDARIPLLSWAMLALRRDGGG